MPARALVLPSTEKSDLVGALVHADEVHHVIAGDYLDEPNLVVVVLHAVDPEGRDIRETVAEEIAALYDGPAVKDQPDPADEQ